MLQQTQVARVLPRYEAFIQRYRGADDLMYPASMSKLMTLAVGFNHRYYPSIKFLKRAIDAGSICTTSEPEPSGTEVH